jgi:oligosaccharide translocation protein RFT1
MSLNGILEAFHASSASPSQIASQAKWMIGSSGAFAGGLWVLGRWGMGGTEQCLVYASCFSMIVRIVYAGNHARQYFKKTIPISIMDILPHPTILAIAAVGGGVVRRLDGIQVLVGVGGFGLITLAAL